MEIILTSKNFADLTNPNLGATAVVVPAIVEMLGELQASASQTLYEEVPSRIGSVEQNFKKCTEFAHDSIWSWFASELSQSLNQAFWYVNRSNLLHSPLLFDDLALHQYEKTPADKLHGIGPHRDFKDFINLVVVVLIQGPSEFYICPDKSGASGTLIDAKPGNIILMRGSEFGDGTLMRPMHYVERLQERRISFGLRQVRDDPEAHVRLGRLFAKQA